MSDPAATVGYQSGPAMEVAGALEFDNVAELKRDGERLLTQHPEINSVDLTKVTKAGSAGISLLLCWLRYAKASGRKLRFVNLPEDMLGVARVTGVEALLTVKDTQAAPAAE